MLSDSACPTGACSAEDGDVTGPGRSYSYGVWPAAQALPLMAARLDHDGGSAKVAGTVLGGQSDWLLNRCTCGMPASAGWGDGGKLLAKRLEKRGGSWCLILTWGGARHWGVLLLPASQSQAAWPVAAKRLSPLDSMVGSAVVGVGVAVAAAAAVGAGVALLNAECPRGSGGLRGLGVERSGTGAAVFDAAVMGDGGE